MTRFLSGIDGFDQLLLTANGAPEAGLKGGSIVLLRGRPGTGKTLLALQLLYRAVARSGDGTQALGSKHRIYMPCEESEESLSKYQGDFGWTAESGVTIACKPFVLDDRPTGRVEATFDRIVEQIQEQMNNRPQILVIDGLTFLQRHMVQSGSRGMEDFTVRRFTRKLFNMLRGLQQEDSGNPQCLYVLTAEFQPTVSADIVPCEEYLADVVIDLSLTETVPGRRQRRLEIKKSRHVRQVLGEHSMWIIGKNERGQESAEAALFGFLPDDIRPGISEGVIVFPRSAPTANGQRYSSDTSISIPMMGFGVAGLDAMLGPTNWSATGGDTGKGVPQRSSTVIMGPAGTGKSLLALSFALQNLEPEGNCQSLVISFDQSCEDIQRFSGNLVALDDDQTLCDAIRSRRLVIAHSDPTNFDTSYFLCLLGKLLDRAKPSRVVIDSVSDIERCLQHPERFGDFLLALFRVLRCTTSVMTYEVEKAPGQIEVSEGGVADLADNVIVTRHIPINDRLRKAIYILKKRGSGFSNDVRELRVDDDIVAETKRVVVTRDLDLYTDLLTGTPRPIEVFLKLFWENKAEKEFNDEIVSRFTDRYLNLKVSSFTKAELEDVLEAGGEQAFESPRSNVKVVSVDEPWIYTFTGSGSDTGRTAELKDLREEFPTSEQADFYYRTIQTARREAYSDLLNEPPDQPDRPLFAVPNYLDIGLFCYRTDILAEHGLLPPASWDDDSDLTSKLGRPCSLPAIWQEIVSRRGTHDGLCGFAFEMSTPQTLVTSFTEFAWNFGANRNFLGSGDEKFRKHNMECVTRALRYLHSLIHKYDRMLPYPCTLQDSARAVFSRQWYSTIQTLILDQKHADLEGKMGLSPFPTSRSFRTDENMQMLRDATDESLRRYERLREDLKTAQNVEPDSSKVRFVAEQIRRLEDRKSELAESSGFVAGNSCSGSWYLAIMESSKTHRLPAMLIREMISPTRSIERVRKGAGLPVRESFYRYYGREVIPNLAPGWTFNRLYHELLGRVRSRIDVLSPEKDHMATQPKRYDEVVRTVYPMVMGALGDERYSIYGDSSLESAREQNPESDPLYAEVVEPLFRRIAPQEQG